MKLLFIGNSATYVHDIPGTLRRLSALAGYDVETAQITPGGYELAQHGDDSSEHGQRVFREIGGGYDIVFLQDNGNCVSSAEKSDRCRDASRRLAEAAKANGAKPFFYVRPPYGKMASGRDALAQCVAFDALFGEIAKEHGIACVYANRAFAYAIEHLNYPLWGEDNAHTSIYGAYLIVCTFFATVFGTSATALESVDGISSEDARVLQLAADTIVFDGCIPWSSEAKEKDYFATRRG